VKIKLLVWVFFLAGACSGEVKPEMLADVQNTDRITIPSAFPAGHYTPYGYIDNPYHSMVFNRSGIIRSVPPLGFGWWRTEFKGNYGGGVRDHVNYLSFLLMSAAVGDKVFLSSDDFTSNGIRLSSEYHSKNMMSYDWQYAGINVSLKYFLPREHSLACLVELENSSNANQSVYLHATNLYGLWETRWWGSDGLVAGYSPELDAGISKIWAYGDVFVLGANLKSLAHKSTDSERQWEGWLRANDTTSVSSFSIHGRGPLRMTQTYRLPVPAKGRASALICLSRGKNQEEASEEYKTALQEALTVLEKQLAEDQSFWQDCPMLQGDWPEHWKHGWVYDWETLRMNVRRPIGIYNHFWDAMQVHSPRAVLGETSLDMMTLSYADADLAKQVIYGTFADAPMPNVPCTREDGSINMISEDGSECGTAPMWGFPFHVIKSIYLATQDDNWIRNLYPYLKAYLEWWLKNRTDQEGWLHCNNSWESGQDGSRRFLISRGQEGAVADYVRTVDVEASMAEAMNNMVLFAKIAGKVEDQRHWNQLAERRIHNTQSMFVDGWFRDFDARSNKPIILEDYFDVMMLSPLTCGIATAEQVKAVQPMFQYFRDQPRHWLEWPPQVFAFCEAAWNAGSRSDAGEVVADIADRVYRRTDSQTALFVDNDQPFSYRVPGVANEFWPMAARPAGGENYGWGATLPMNLIRDLIGFREADSAAIHEIYFAPALPEKLLTTGNKYRITNLHFAGITFDLACEVKLTYLHITADYRLPKPLGVKVTAENGQVVLSQVQRKLQGSLSYDAKNGDIYKIRFE